MLNAAEVWWFKGKSKFYDSNLWIVTTTHKELQDCRYATMQYSDGSASFIIMNYLNTAWSVFDNYATIFLAVKLVFHPSPCNIRKFNKKQLVRYMGRLVKQVALLM